MMSPELAALYQAFTRQPPDPSALPPLERAGEIVARQEGHLVSFSLTGAGHRRLVEYLWAKHEII